MDTVGAYSGCNMWPPSRFRHGDDGCRSVGKNIHTFSTKAPGTASKGIYNVQQCNLIAVTGGRQSPPSSFPVAFMSRAEVGSVETWWRFFASCLGHRLEITPTDNANVENSWGRVFPLAYEWERYTYISRGSEPVGKKMEVSKCLSK